jgi:hypothetical protein
MRANTITCRLNNLPLAREHVTMRNLVFSGSKILAGRRFSFDVVYGRCTTAPGFERVSPELMFMNN